MENWINIYRDVLSNVNQKFGFAQNEGTFSSYFFVIVSYLLLITFIVLIGITIKKIAERRVYRYLFVAAFAIMANLAFIVMPKKVAILPLFLGVIAMNVGFYFFIKFDRKFKRQYLIDHPLKSDDLMLTEQSAPKEMKLIKCPNCKHLTISYYHILKAPQSCGYCHKKFKINGSEIKLIVYFVLAFIIFALGFFMLIKKAYPPFVFLLMGAGYLNYFLYKLRLMRLKEV